MTILLNPRRPRAEARSEMLLLSRFKAALCRALAALGVALLFILLLLPHLPWKRYQLLEVGLMAFILICYLGKLLYDTLFYDRYWPYTGHKGSKHG